MGKMNTLSSIKYCTVCLLLILVIQFCLTPCMGQNLIGIDDIPASLTSCDREEDSMTKANYGWPVDISCRALSNKYHHALSFEEDESLRSETMACIIREIPSGNEIHNKSVIYEPFFREDQIDGLAYFTEDITEDTPSTYVVQYTIADHCSYQIVQLQKTALVNPSCNNYTEEYINIFKADLGSVITPRCRTADPVLSYLKNTGQLTYKWLYNCGEAMNDNVLQQGNGVAIQQITYEETGTYTCIVVYKGQEMYNMQHHVCVQFDSTAEQGFSIECPEILPVKIGHDMQITCHADLGLGKANRILVSSDWSKTENTSAPLCQTMNEGILFNSTSDPRLKCMAISSVEESECYSPSNPQPAEPPHDIYQVLLTISNVTQSDLDSYTLKFTYSSSKLFANVTLIEDRTEKLAGEIAAITTGVIFFFLLLLLILLCIWKKHDVLWYWKKHFGPYEREIYTYTAYIAYYYDNDPQKMTDKSRIHTETLVPNVEKYINQLHGTTYNDQKQVNMTQYDAENLMQVLADCHRIIILLSPEYINDHWSLHTTHQALEEVVNTGKKLIFVTMPGAKKAISLSDAETKQTLYSAMKRNITVNWSGKVPFVGTFKRRMEYALPKMPPPGYNRCLSDSSEAHLTMHNRHTERQIPVSENGYVNGFDSV
uniref:uncharacterized protein LOC120346433 isoform X1 n=1 Tax=Styela clava TaxID=7725 RepID=UPI001939EA3B|nr:uncharacterized protein LOC120346433 isoform X1 [Styela clava]XP_039272103.1 uncharacterized protein LOC120346433 isoform X1 [Styela clava]XP_039272104.1 uncharacterized protein LOC120346433 isoform X1 [Styela clava]